MLLIVALTAFTACFYQKKIDNQKVEDNVYAIFGEGDLGEGMKYIILTGDTTNWEERDELTSLYIIR